VDSNGQVRAHQKEPCAIHGNGGDGKAAYVRLVEGWKHAVEHKTSIAVSPPPFSTGIALYNKGDLDGAEKAFREGVVRERHSVTLFSLFFYNFYNNSNNNNNDNMKSHSTPSPPTNHTLQDKCQREGPAT
jgi:hypothetical protein